MPDQVVDPYRAYNFKLTFQPGITEAHFTEISGIGINVVAIPYREGGMRPSILSVPGYVEYSPITLRYGLTSSHELFDWFMTAVNGKVQRRNVSILLLDSDSVAEVMRWDLVNAWPSQWRGTVLNGMAREVAIESLTLVYETLQRA
jgi:phage tail-like protein